MNKIFLFLALLAPFGKAAAQPRTSIAQNRFLLFAASQYNFNRNAIANDESLPDPLSAKNTVGYSLGLGYQRTTRGGALFRADFLVGRMRHSVRYDVDLSFYDRDAEDLRGRTISGSIVSHINYLQLRLMAGYRFAARKKWPIDVLGGAAVKYYPGAKTEDKVGRFSYLSNDQQTLYRTTAFEYINALTNEAFAVGTATYELYIGTKKELKDCFVDEITLGLEAAHAWGIGPTAGNGLTFITFNSSGRPSSVDEYIDHNFLVGLRLGIRVFH